MSLHERFSEQELEILKARAKRAAASIQTEQAADLLTVLVARVRSEMYALPIESILAVYEYMAVTPLPCVPEYVAGLVNVRGHLLPVLDLATLLNVPGKTEDENTTLVVASGGDFSVAVLIDQAHEVKTLDSGDLLPIPATLDSSQAAYLRGLTPDGLALLDLQLALNDPALIVNQPAV